ncbi:glycoside hydrolase family 3 N-terminal domain-containing protein [uncultured Duncaniella sp.]|uniref:glycoside hydrolase family 3 N-terminal domain-containing protein n=1 Tax=uncultured Duncaniella sp. TaxID=2768039 RepID=UPI0025B68034|nr:glycoside hydrolase family 3 N-terminal domain-containing protein [uncultured Duncaniella sp.]
MRATHIIAASAIIATALSTTATTPVYLQASKPTEERVADLLSRMTLEEKAGQLLCPMGWEMYERRPDGSIAPSEKFREQNRGKMPVGGYWATLRADPWTQKTLENGLSPAEGAAALNALQAFAIDSTRLGIPILFAEECPHGHMAIGATVYPTGLSMAGTWHPELIRRAGEEIALEARSTGAGVGYGPVLDIAREPRWSRMEETFGEDPWLSGVMGAAMVEGMQGRRGSSVNDGRHLYSTLKHFAAYGVPEGGHNGAEASVGPVRLRSELLEPFRHAIAAGAATVMSSYNSVDGIPCTANRELLTGLLRDEWGFTGAVYSDLYSIDVLAGHTASDRTEAGAQALKAGVDIDLGAACYGKRAIEALQRGLITEADIDTAVARILRLKFDLGLFERPFTDPKEATRRVGADSHRATAREIARQGTALLKNEGALLPLDRKRLRRIAVIGPNADEQYNQLGDYTAPQPDDNITTILEGLRQAAPDVEIVYVKGCAIRDTAQTDIAAAVEAALAADVTVLAVGGSSARDFKTSYAATGAAQTDASHVSDMDCGEGFDRATLTPLGDQLRLMQAIYDTGKPVVTVYIQGRTLDMNLAARHSDALLTAWYPGQEGGSAIADIIFGDVNPSGRLPVSIPRSEGQLPVHYSRMSTGRDYMDGSGSPLYSFGHGLSYTTFDYSDLTIIPTDNGDRWDVSFRLTNTGRRQGAEVAQLYLRDAVASTSQPPMLLKRFKRIELNPGESREVHFSLGPDELSIYNPALRRVVEPGLFRLMIGSSSNDIRLKGEFTVK